jgi:hypothetical protein
MDTESFLETLILIGHIPENWDLFEHRFGNPKSRIDVFLITLLERIKTVPDLTCT